MGAGVPRPCSAKRANASTTPGTPARIIIAPMPRVSSRPRNGGRSCQPVIDHGTSPANVNGATTKKTAEPRTALVRCTAVPDTRCELIQSSSMVSRRHPGADTLARLLRLLNTDAVAERRRVEAVRESVCRFGLRVHEERQRPVLRLRQRHV